MMKNENGEKVFFFSFYHFIFFTTYEHHWKCLLDVQRGNTQHCGLDISRLPFFLINNKDYYVPNANLLVLQRNICTDSKRRAVAISDAKATWNAHRS